MLGSHIDLKYSLFQSSYHIRTMYTSITGSGRALFKILVISEFLDEVSIDAFNKYSHFDMKVAPSLFLEFHGAASGLDAQVELVGE